MREIENSWTFVGQGVLYINKLVDSNLPNKNMLYNMDSKTLSTELELNKLFAKNSPYMPAPEIKEVPKVDAPAKTVQQAEKTVKNEAFAGGPVA